jgi:hypothetical protein
MKWAVVTSDGFSRDELLDAINALKQLAQEAPKLTDERAPRR